MKTFIISTILFIGTLAVVSSCGTTQAERRESPFEYREIYLTEGMGKNAKKLGLNSVDNDWGIWGHNLITVAPHKPYHSIFAKINGNTNEDQFCFMSNHLFEYICDYIDNNFSNEDSVKFAILPNDNEIVCLCTKCVTEGNTSHNASPAVFHMIRRLCERFPTHTFFTSHYSTTSQLPNEKLPANSGVLLSAMTYPRVAGPTPQEQDFEKLIAAWGEKVSKVYVWDYINNFDDYFTPIPIFDVMQRRLQLYERAGVDGIFFNGSGSDYSTMRSIKAKVLAALTENPDIDWRPLLKEICMSEYPAAGEIIYDFMIQQEEYAKATGKELPMYDGTKAELESYLPGQDFINFYNRLNEVRAQTAGKEKIQLDTLCAAMSLSRLELARLSGNIEGSEDAIALLSTLIDSSTEYYNESSWLIERYVKDYKYALEHARNFSNKNLLKGKALTPRTPLDPDYRDLSIVTDGLLGIPSDYHAGNLLYSSPRLTLTIPYEEGMSKLSVGFITNRQYHIGLPLKVALSHNDKNIGSIVPKPEQDHHGHAFAIFDIPADVNGPMTLTVTLDPDYRSIGIDEIEAY